MKDLLETRFESVKTFQILTTLMFGNADKVEIAVQKQGMLVH